jgi:concanavalin A-like lectin/glucanase superfamily protein
MLSVAGVCGLLVIGLTVKHFLGSDAPDHQAVQEQVAAVAGERTSAHSGWAAKSGPLGEPGQASRRGDGTGSGARAGSARDGGAGDAESADGSHGSADAMYGARRRSQIAGGSDTASGDGGSIEVGGPLRDPKLAFEGPKGLKSGSMAHGGLGVERVTVPGNASTNPDDKADETGLVLSMPMKDSAEPEKGDTPPVVQQGVSFDSEGMKFAADSQFVVPNAGNIKGDAGTISFWINPEWDPTDGTDASLVQLREPNRFENQLQIAKNGQFLRFIFADNTGIESGAGYQMNWQPGENHMVTATWGEALTTLYVDGQKVGQQPYSGQLEVNPNTPLYIGSDYPGFQPGARGTMSQFQVYNRPLAPQEVGGLVAQRTQ